jgi:hypothetical protein
MSEQAKNGNPDKKTAPTPPQSRSTGAKAGQEPKDAVKHAAGQPLGKAETLSEAEAKKLSGKPSMGAKNEIPTH